MCEHCILRHLISHWDHWEHSNSAGAAEGEASDQYEQILPDQPMHI